MNKYERLKRELEVSGTGKMKCFGNSMTPILKNATLNTYVVQKEYEVGDIVFCKVKGRYIDSHLITKKSNIFHLCGYQLQNSRHVCPLILHMQHIVVCHLE